MKEKTIQQLVLVLNALNSIAVSGKSNLANLSGSISILEEVVSALDNIKFVQHVEESKET